MADDDAAGVDVDAVAWPPLTTIRYINVNGGDRCAASSAKMVAALLLTRWTNPNLDLKLGSLKLLLLPPTVASIPALPLVEQLFRHSASALTSTQLSSDERVARHLHQHQRRCRAKRGNYVNVDTDAEQRKAGNTLLVEVGGIMVRVDLIVVRVD